ncbi:hypothetical protein KUL42_18120 [Alteromonas sp. KUL42]|uniref:Wzz/FepE/Etk N-terminal domain-containing protein n=1 Tax=Alteromonas sp. KUL42 TaxID=2480797 RepID=UPI00103699B8|nr:Wzz/FepE/Etk N-terminal domain-containing protein [Alteromonas sp. KUL42]TAP35573.1 hypothetical protein EYR97_08925 [Alteromonas sp. KUL42]GEA07051.1 hypothetical protein KUL42_18120 [Alteromonas sp. KUL42]
MIQQEIKKNGVELNSDEVDLVDLIFDIKGRWKTLVFVTFIGALLSIILSLILPKEYSSSVEFSLPTDADVLELTNHSLIEFDKEDVFLRFFNKLKAVDNFTSFLKENNLLQQLYPEATESESILISKSVSGLFFNVLEQKSTNPPDLQFPTKVSIQFTHTDEALLVNILNEYVKFTADGLLSEISTQSNAIRAIKVEELNERMIALREAAQLERQRQIALLEEANSLKLSQLHQRYDLVLEKSKKNNVTQILEAKEALQIAQKLNIKLPTSISDFGNTERDIPLTNVNISENFSLPLFLMGTTYLNSLIEALESRKNQEFYVEALNEIESEIQRIKDDKLLESLKSRVSDDNHIEELTEIKSKLRELKRVQLKFKAGTMPITIAKSAIQSGEAYAPDNVVIVVIGTLAGCFIGAIICLLMAALERRKLLPS